MIATMNPTEVLTHEHELILKALSILSSMATNVEAGKPVSKADLGGILDFFKSFTDGCHHAKEEKALFPAMEAAGMPHDAGPVAMMLYEHEIGRGHMRSMVQSVDALESSADARRRFVDAVRGYEILLSQHIDKENTVLFRMAENMLSPEAKRQIADAFERHEAEMGVGVHERYHALIKDLAGRYMTEGKGLPRGTQQSCCGGGHCS